MPEMSIKLLGVLILSIPAPFFAYKSLGKFLIIEKNIWKKILLSVATLLLVHMIIFIADLANLIPTIILFMSCVCFCFKGTILPKIAVGMLFSTMAFSFNGIMDNYVYIFITNAYITVGFRTFFWFFIYLILRWYSPEKDYILSEAMWKLMVLLTLTPLGIVLSVVLLSPLDKTQTYGMMSSLLNFVLLTLSLISVVGLLWTIRMLSQQQKLERQKVLFQINSNYYQSVEKQQLEVRRLKHDMANHLRALTALPETEKDNYIETLLNQPIFSQQLTYCGDSVINAVLNEKADKIKNLEIDFSWKIDIPKELPYDKPDICALFANALDNAIEASELLPVKERKITLEVRDQKGLLVMNITNACMSLGKYSFHGVTSKSDHKNHGFGLQSIQDVVSRYGGKMEIKKEEDFYSLFLYIPNMEK